MIYQTTTEASRKTGLSSVYIRRLAQTGRIAGAEKVGKTWLIPQDWTPPQLKRGNPNFKRKTEPMEANDGMGQRKRPHAG